MCTFVIQFYKESSSLLLFKSSTMHYLWLVDNEFSFAATSNRD